MKLSDYRTATKFAAISAICVVAAAGMMALSHHGNASVADAMNGATSQLLNTHDIQTVKSEILGMAVSGRDVRLAESTDDMRKAFDLMVAHRQRADQMTSALIARLRVPENRELANRLRQLTADYENTIKTILPLKVQMLKLETAARSGDAAAAGSFFERQSEMFATLRSRKATFAATAGDLVARIDANASGIAQQLQAKATGENEFVDRSGIAFGLFVIMVIVGAAMFSVLTIARPLQALAPRLQELARGNFAVSIPGTARKDEVGMIAAAAEAVVVQVGAIIGNIKLVASEVASASAEISAATTDLSQRTEEQAASLEETSASMEQIAATVRRNTENAQQANEFAAKTSIVAERSGTVVADAVAAMARIEESSHKISDIIGVIDEIARQTNLLALNAAVEAARAGDAGRGFAVVASEVRSLAQRSSQAAKDIKQLIVNSSSQVEDGVDLVSKAGQSLGEIVGSIKKVAAFVADIADASSEQSSGIEQINKALTQMDGVTQQNSALVEENAATAKALEQQARSMDERVAAFRLRADTAAAGGAALASTASAGTAAVAHSTRPQVARPVRHATTGGARQMQTALATAIVGDREWQEF